jgi:hypothetical protein
MLLKEVGVRSEGELISKLEQVTLKGFPQKHIYSNCHISIERVHPNYLSPPQRYVHRDELKKVQDVRWKILEEFGHDILQLRGYIKCVYEGESFINNYEGGKLEQYDDFVIDILPPVVEEYFGWDGKPHLLINDGMHRAFIAYQMQMPFNIVYIRGVSEHYPYYANPLPAGWRDVEILDIIPEGYIKKFHVVKDHKALFRDFNVAFENIGESRQYGK